MNPQPSDAHDDLLAVHSCGVWFYVLRDGAALYLIDTGFLGGKRALDRALQDRGWQGLPIRGILLTHGHLDHLFNVEPFARRDGAWVAAPASDLPFCEGRARYQGLRRIVGLQEAIGRRCFGISAFTPDRLVEEGDTFPIWGGLRAVALPGHTPGHTGYFCASRSWLFCGDLFASYGPLSHRPPGLFNSDSGEARRSIRKALALEPGGVFPHHRDGASPEKHLERLRKLM